LAYEAEEEWPAVRGLITAVIPFGYFVIQLGQMVAAFFLLLIARFESVPIKVRKFLTIASGFMILISVLAMRFNVVVGGQLVSKSLSGYSEFQWPLWHEGVIPTIGFLILPFVFLLALVKLLPPWMAGEEALLQPVSPAKVDSPAVEGVWGWLVSGVSRSISRLGIRGLWREE